MDKKRTPLLMAAGAIGPVLFWLVVIVDGFTEPGYDARKAFISELALGQHGWVQRANFVVVGLLMLFLAVGLRRLFSTGRASLFGPLLAGLFGLCLIASGVFSTDPMYFPPGADTTTPTVAGAIHGLAFLVLLVSVIAGCLVFARRFRQEPAWRGYGLYSVITVALVVALLVVNAVVAVAYVGVAQRALVAVFFLWYEVIALHALRIVTSAPETAVSEAAIDDRLPSAEA
jgi:hypothetical membrane protein